jgi:transposase InsO family protein
LWLNDGSCVRLRAERPNNVWSYDFMQDRTEDGRRFRMLTGIDEFTRRCPAIVVARKLNSDDVHDCVTHLFVAHGAPENVRSDNGPEFVARMRAPGSPDRREDALHRAGQPLGERLLRGLQLQAARRTPGGGAILDLVRSKGAHRALVSVSARLRSTRPAEGLATRGRVLTQCLAPN